eukprot:Seg2232.4 transcript_id=Seg2232.4/GoldUCD/mRNA.D3Y31 product="hypothetical protein" protein_id=Seg2232.4/GoldUCD/D3Y31
MFPLLSSMLFAFISSSLAERKCNGLAGLCRLKLNQVTLAGTHNSGAGFDGVLRYGSGVAALSCFYRNQGASITGQLDLGVRYFDIDSCWDSSSSSAWACHSAAYGGPIEKIFSQIDQWMKQDKNRNEVVVIHFNRDYEKGKEITKTIGADVIKRLKSYWEPTTERLQSKQLAIQTHYSATLGEAIKNNQRIYIFMHDDLSDLADHAGWLFWQHYVGFTWHSMVFITSSGCQKLADKVASNCAKEARNRSLVRLDLYLSSGLCIHDMASWCNKRMPAAADKCRKNARKYRKTINFIVIDYADIGAGRKVADVARNQNLENIKYFS